jgi:apolipoprotein N-acyltransferase
MITFWLGYEYITLNVNLISPWLNLGNGLSKDIMFIQWYEATGTGGGTLWILMSNLLISIFLVKLYYGKKRTFRYLWIWLVVIIIPSLISITRYNSITENKTDPVEIVIIQPDFDPYTEKFAVPFETQLRRVVSMASAEATGKTGWIITPETTVDDPVNLDDLNNNKYVSMIRELIKTNPDLSVLTGFVTFRLYPPTTSAPTVSARKTGTGDSYYDHFNSALKIDSSKQIEVYHKSKLVPGIELQFSSGPGRFISKILPFLGGTKWGYGVQYDRTCVENRRTGQKFAPIICYESVFGKFITGYVKNGAEGLFIITNDGWWKNTNGYKQHLCFASLRAIETRRPIARAANTGVSCFIDIRGVRTVETGWWTRSSLRGNMFPETGITPYVKYGDYLMVISSVLSLMIILIIFIINPIRKRISRVE